MLARALERNPGIRSMRTTGSAAMARATGAGAWSDPEVGFEMMGTPVTSVNPFKDAMEYDYSISQMFMFPGKLSLMGKMAEAQAGMAGEDAEWGRLAVVMEVKDAYAMLYSAQRRLDAVDEQNSAVRAIIDMVRSRLAVGKASEADIARLDVEELQTRNERSRIVQEAAAARSGLVALQALPAGAPVGELAEPPVLPPPPEPETLVRAAMQRNPSLRAMRFEAGMRSADLELSRKAWLPDIMLKGVYKQMPMGQTDAWSMMVGLAVPIAPWASPKYSARHEAAELTVRAVDDRIADMENMLRTEIESTWLNAVSLWERLTRQRKEVLPRAREALDGLLAQYQTDRGSVLAVLDAWRMLKMYVMDEAMLTADYCMARNKLDHITGGAQ
jgi:outer membrane protein TolC